ncbi:MAG: DUF4389 domain-containing protein [Kofleriaceae bacterium]
MNRETGAIDIRDHGARRVPATCCPRHRTARRDCAGSSFARHMRARRRSSAGTIVALDASMLPEFPVHLEVTSPARFDRIQLLLRIALGATLAWVGITAGWLASLLYCALPVIVALAVSSLGGERFARELAPKLWRVLRWVIQLSAYMMLVIDRFPTGEDDAVHIDLRFTGHPTIGSALARLAMSIPSALVLVFLAVPSGLLWLIGAGLILLGGPMPAAILAFQRGVLRWQVRLLAYHASLVEDYPPFAFETDHGRGDQRAESVAP